MMHMRMTLVFVEPLCIIMCGGSMNVCILRNVVCVLDLLGVCGCGLDEDK